MRRTPLLAALACSLLPRTEARAGELPEDVRQLAAEVAALGTEARPWFELDLARLQVEERPAAECAGPLADELARLRPEARRATRVALLAAWGREIGGDEEAVRMRRLPARYLVGRQRLQLVRGASAPEGFASRGLLLVHELVRAWQDQQLGLAPRLEAAAATSERTWLLQALLEGQAGAVALAVSRARIRSSLREVDPDGLEVPAEQELLGALQGLCLGRGRAFAVRAFQRGGWAALRDLLASPPASSEQLLHPSKLGSDAPREVQLPPWPGGAGPAELVDEDVLGELGVLALLVEAGLPPGEAALAASGWDGDRLAVYRTPDGRRAVLWRTVWDREEDAAQLQTALEGRWAGRWELRGRVLEAVWAEGRAELEGALMRALHTRPIRADAEGNDAATTAREEEGLNRRAVLGSERWSLREEGISLPIPPEWFTQSLQGRTYLMAPPVQGFSSNINVLRTFNASGDDGEALARQTRQELEGGGGRVLALSRRQGPRGEPAVLAEYTLRYQGRPLHFLVLVVAQGREELVITATAPEEHWEGRKALFAAILDDVRVLE